MSSLTDIVDGLAGRLLTIPAFDQNVLTVARRPSTFPAAIILPPAIPEYGASAADTAADGLVLQVLVVVGAVDAEQQHSLFPFLDWSGASSVKAAVASDRTLGLDDVDARVMSVPEPPGLIEFPDGTPCFGATIHVQVVTG